MPGLNISRVLPAGVPPCGRASAQLSRRNQIFRGPEFRKGLEIMQSANVEPLTLPAAAVRDLRPNLLRDDRCQEWLFQNIHRNEAKCPECGEILQTERARASFFGRKRVRCQKCGKFFDYRTGTILAGTSLQAETIYLLSLLLGLGLPDRQISDLLGLDRGTVRDWRDRLSIGSLAVKSIHPIGEGTAARRGEGEA